jgi:uncharacterized membrane protein YeiH
MDAGTVGIVEVPLWTNALAIGVGSLQGAMYASGFRDRKLDLLGISIIGVATGLGGGFLRDILLNRLPVALTENWYIGVAVMAALIGMLFGRIMSRVDWLITTLDALAIGLFGAIGVTTALSFGLPDIPAIFVGVVSAVGGGVMRDLLLNMPISVMLVGSLYAVAAGVGTLVLITMYSLGSGLVAASIACVAVTTVIRLFAVRFGWSLPEQRILRGLRNPRLARPNDFTGPIETQKKDL